MMSCLASSPKIATAISSPAIIPFLLAGGFFINTGTLNHFFAFLKWASWFHYGFESMMISQWSNIDSIPCNPINSTMTNGTAPTGRDQRCLLDGASVLAENGLTPANLWWDIGGLLMLILIMRLFAFFALYRQSFHR